VVLTGIGGVAGAGTVRSAETWIAAFRSAHARFTLPAVLVAGVALALLVWSRRAPSGTWTLAAMGAVLVFGGHAVRLGEVRWLASYRIEASGDLRSLRAAQTRLVALAEVRRRLARLGADDTTYLASFVHAAESKKHRAAIVAEKAERLAAQTGEPAVPPAARPATAEWEAVQRSEVWLRTSDVGDSDSSPSIDDLDVLARAARNVRAREAEARKSMDALAGAVVDATATRWTGQEWGAAVWDLASAERLVGDEERGGESWDVVTQADGVKTSALAEVDASERNFEASESSGRGEWDWADGAR
jgi:hypothetical protein